MVTASLRDHDPYERNVETTDNRTVYEHLSVQYHGGSPHPEGKH